MKKPQPKPAAAKESTSGMTITFTGDPRGKSNPDRPEYEGISFPLGKSVHVDDAEWIAKFGDRIKRNSHFSVEE